MLLTNWTDARRPVPRLWIRSAEERGERRYENWNTTQQQVLLTNIDVNKACTTERGNRYLPVVSKDLCPYYHNYNATNYVTS